MCGIAGLYCLSAPCDGGCHRATVERLTRLQLHRGPDDGGVEALGRACLGARRLSIIDLSAAGHMPMSDATGRWWIVYNGEVYNFRELRRELTGLGHVFRSATDTEVVLHAFMEWGQDAVRRLVGMFAFAVYDRLTETLTLVRDRYGIKPLYYTSDREHLLFASEMKVLTTVRGDVRPNGRRLAEWLLYRNVDAFGPDTFVEGIRAVEPGEALFVEHGETRSAPVYRLTEQVRREEYERLATLSAEKAVDELEAAIQEATVARLVSDVPVGTLLSGGLDSSLVTAIAARHAPSFKAFHVSVAGFPQLDEARHAEALTRSHGLELVTFDLTPRAFRRQLPAAVWASDLPLTHPNSVAYHEISRVARQHGVIVLLSGEGADELFGGYAWRYRRLRTLLRLRPLLEAVPARVKNILELLLYADEEMPVTSRGFRDLLPSTVLLLDRGERLAWQLQCEAAYGFLGRPRERAVMGKMLGDLRDFLSPLLRRLDRMTMAASVECRVPFLDHRVVHRVINLPLAYRLGWGADKWILRRVAARHIPDVLTRRRKKGFPLPLAEYVAPFANLSFFRGGYLAQEAGVALSAMEREMAGWRRNPRGLFGLITLELWGRLYVRGESVAELRGEIGALEGSAASKAAPCPV